MDTLQLYFKRLYKVYDALMTWMNFPARYCSQCEKKIRHWVYHFHGLVYCQGCADVYVAKLQDGQLEGERGFI